MKKIFALLFLMILGSTMISGCASIRIPDTAAGKPPSHAASYDKKVESDTTSPTVADTTSPTVADTTSPTVADTTSPTVADTTSDTASYTVTDTGYVHIAGVPEPIIGIPDPPFGITTNHTILYGSGSGATYDYPDDSLGPVPYRIGPDGPYTHYIDPDDPNSTDTNNPCGTYKVPRKTQGAILSNLAAGSVVEIHNSTAIGEILNGSGAAAAPVFIRGVRGSEPTITGIFGVNCSYLIIENIKFDLLDYSRKTVRIGLESSKPITHVAVRHCEFFNGKANPYESYQPIRIMHDWNSTDLVQNIVIYNNYFHNIGDERTMDVKNDVVCVSIDTNAVNVWVLYNYFHNIGGDAVQVSADKCDATYVIPNHIYIGKNLCHDMYENFLDLKMCEDVIASQNTVWNTNGWNPDMVPFRYGFGDMTPDGLTKNNIWTLFNTCYDISGTAGMHVFGIIREGRVFPDEIYFIGNLVYNLHAISGNAYAFGAWYCQSVYWLNNVVWNVDKGFSIAADLAGSYPNSQQTVVNNIISDLHASSVTPYHLEMYGLQAALDRAEVSNNIYYEPGTDAKVRWGVTNPITFGTLWSEYTFDQFASYAPAKAAGCLEADPRHISPAAADFRLRSDSPAIDAGAVHDAYVVFKARYGISIQVDYSNVAVPKLAGYDIGAYEY